MVEVRTFQSDDVAFARAIWNEVVLEGRAFPQKEPLADDASALAFFEDQTRTAVAVMPSSEGGVPQVVGLSILHPNNVGRCAHIANASYAVASAARGHGIGRALVEDSLRSLRSCGFTGLQFNAVVASNAGAIGLYESLGFTRVGAIPGGFQNAEGAFEDIIIFYHDAPSTWDVEGAREGCSLLIKASERMHP